MLETVTRTGAEVAGLPVRSRASAVMSCGPFGTGRLSHWIEYGAVVSALPTSAPSTLNWTDATASSSAAAALTVTLPETVAPTAGAVTETVGAVVSAVAVAFAWFEAGPTFPAASAAVTT